MADLFIPLLLPEETLEGYRGRIRLLNGLTDDLAVVHAMNGHRIGCVGNQRSIVSFAEMVADRNGLRIYDVVMRHSLWPYTHAIDRPRRVEDVELMATSKAGRTAVMRSARPHAWLCPECVHEDVEFWHVSYWRRTHQLPGVIWCDKHRCALRWTGLAAVQAGPPDHCIDLAVSWDSSNVCHLQKIPEVQRFLDICVGLLESDLYLERTACATALVRAAKERGLCSNGEDAGAALTDRALQAFPEEWRREAFPKIDWQHSRPIGMIDAACRVQRYPASTQAIALVSALVFDSADQALIALSTTTRTQCGQLASRLPGLLTSSASAQTED